MRFNFKFLKKFKWVLYFVVNMIIFADDTIHITHFMVLKQSNRNTVVFPEKI